MVGKEGLINEFDEDLIENFNKLLKKVESWRCMGENIALCHGCFDPLHVGHVAHFRAASQLADRLIVTLTPDIYINKSAGRPFIKQRQRLYMVSELKMVDICAINLWPTAVETIKLIRPNYFIKGSDYKDRTKCNQNIIDEENSIKSVGGTLLYTNEISYSSTELIAKGAFGK